MFYVDLALALDLAGKVFLSPPTTLIPDRPASAYVPNPEWLRDEIAAGRIRGTDLIEQMRGSLKPRWAAFDAHGDGFSRLSNIKAQSNAAVAAFHPPSRFDSVWSNLAFRLDVKLDTTARGGRVTAEELLTADDTNFATKLDRITDTPERAAEAIVMLRRIDDVLTRITVARRAAEATGRPLAEVLALYRREGSLCVFPSEASLLQGIPAWVRDNDPPKASQRARDPFPSEPSLIGLVDRPDFTYLTWLADPDKATGRAGGASIERYALATAFLVQSAGLDKVGGQWDPARIVDIFAKLSAEWWDLAGMAPGLRRAEREADARTRWETMEGELVLTRNFRGLSGSEPPVHKIAPRNPEALIAAALTEGVAFFDFHRKASTLTGTDTNKTFGPALTAARYNCHATPRLVPGLIVSALFSAQDRQSSPLWDAFKNDNAFLAFLKGVKEHARKGKTSAHRQSLQEEAASVALERVRPELGNWLLAGNNRDLLDDYIRTTGKDVWGGYAIKGSSPRTYAWSFVQLSNFYASIFPNG